MVGQELEPALEALAVGDVLDLQDDLVALQPGHVDVQPDGVAVGAQVAALAAALLAGVVDVGQRRADELLARFDLADTGARPVGKYSGGMRRRLDLAVSLILAPAVLFLDEPTTGLDPRSRADVWQAVRGLVAEGTTVLLTTQYLDEADQLADRISVLAAPKGRGGRVVAEGTPDELRSRIGGDRIDLVVRHAADLPCAAALLERVAGTAPDVEPATRRVAAPVPDRMEALTAVVHGLHREGIDAEDLTVRRPTLDEVFLHLTATGVAA
jgi:ABC-2 type transport system ATP-binding protein